MLWREGVIDRAMSLRNLEAKCLAVKSQEKTTLFLFWVLLSCALSLACLVLSSVSRRGCGCLCLSATQSYSQAEFLLKKFHSRVEFSVLCESPVFNYQLSHLSPFYSMAFPSTDGGQF